ncbi:hypothetical protein C5D98_12470 [Rathayibacter rathayi]|nr:hypothetical protein C5D98_12470 [Rathayibacter rathayi]
MPPEAVLTVPVAPRRLPRSRTRSMSTPSRVPSSSVSIEHSPAASLTGAGVVGTVGTGRVADSALTASGSDETETSDGAATGLVSPTGFGTWDVQPASRIAAARTITRRCVVRIIP